MPFDKCILNNFWKLPAGHYAIFSNNDLHIRRYWELTYTGDIYDEHEATELLLNALKESVCYQLISDVPVGVFLSGGIDSSAVTALVDATHPENLNTYTIGFDEEKFNEIPYAAKVSKLFSSNHHEQVVTYEYARRKLNTFVDIYDEPFFDCSGIPTFIISEMAKKDVKVILSGDGGDEIFAGYKRYDQFEKFAIKQGVNGSVQRLLAMILLKPLQQASKFSPRFRKAALITKHRLQNPVSNYFQLVGFLHPQKQNQILFPGFTDACQSSPYWLIEKFWHDSYPRVAAAQYVDIHTYLADDILTKVDRVSMANGLEVRVPLLDYRLVELAFRISCGLQYAKKERKYLFKRSLEKLLPQETLSIRKKGFSVPMENWLNKIQTAIGKPDHGWQPGRPFHSKAR